MNYNESNMIKKEIKISKWAFVLVKKEEEATLIYSSELENIFNAVNWR